MSMMEEGDEARGFEREIYWFNEQAEMWLDSVDRILSGSTSTGSPAT